MSHALPSTEPLLPSLIDQPLIVTTLASGERLSPFFNSKKSFDSQAPHLGFNLSAVRSSGTLGGVQLTCPADTVAPSTEVQTKVFSEHSESVYRVRGPK